MHRNNNRLPSTHLSLTNSQVEDSFVVMDRETQRSRGFGFVTMEEEAGKRAIEETDGIEWMGRALRVNQAEERPPGDRPSFGRGGGGRGYGRGRRDDGEGGGGYERREGGYGGGEGGGSVAGLTFGAVERDAGDVGHDEVVVTGRALFVLVDPLADALRAEGRSIAKP